MLQDGESQIISRVLPLVFASVIVSAALVPVAASPSMLLNVQVNRSILGPFPTNNQQEPSLAQNPTNPLNLIAGSMDLAAEPACTNTTPSTCFIIPGVPAVWSYASFDGGNTWPCQSGLDLSSFGEFAVADPSQTFDGKGNAYFSTNAFLIQPNTATLASDFRAGNLDLFVSKSTDGGCHYTSAVMVSGPSPAVGADKSSIAADSSPSSPFRDNVYVAWTSRIGSLFEAIVFSRSSDGGSTWSKPIQISQGADIHLGAQTGATVKVGPDGTVYVVWAAGVPDTKYQIVQEMAISHDGGQTFTSKNVLVATTTDDLAQFGTNMVPGSSFRQASRLFPSLTITPYGTLFVAWSNRVGDPADGHASVLLARSADGGMTWSAPIIGGDVPGRSAFFSYVTSDPGGDVDIVFQALDDVPWGTPPIPGIVHYDTYLAQSTNGGVSFDAPVKISTANSDPDGSSNLGLASSGSSQLLGDYLTAVADNGHVYAVWTDARNATPCPAVDLFRFGLGPAPDIITQCPASFGNTDIFIGIL